MSLHSSQSEVGFAHECHSIHQLTAKQVHLEVSAGDSLGKSDDTVGQVGDVKVVPASAAAAAAVVDTVLGDGEVTVVAASAAAVVVADEPAGVARGLGVGALALNRVSSLAPGLRLWFSESRAQLDNATSERGK
jgi:hypothetical protein